MRIRCGRRVGKRPGSAAVEFAIVLPILVLLLTGIWEVGRLVQVTQIVSNAAREGARLASTGAVSSAAVDTAVHNYLVSSGITTTGYTVKVYNLTQNPDPPPGSGNDEPTNGNQMDHFEVRVTLPFNNVKWIFLNQLTNVTTISANAEWNCMKDQPLVVDTTLPTG